jgi:hypothetical protein
MDKATLRKDLERADRHVADAQQLVERQRKRVRELDAAVTTAAKRINCSALSRTSSQEDLPRIQTSNEATAPTRVHAIMAVLGAGPSHRIRPASARGASDIVVRHSKTDPNTLFEMRVNAGSAD